MLLVVACVEGELTSENPEHEDSVESPYADCAGASEVDDDLNGEYEEAHTLDYDHHGYLVRYTTDEGSDGITNAIEHYEVSSTGEVLVRDNDADGDGVVDKRWTYLRDAEEWLESVEYDEGVDGILEWVTRVTTTWDDEGRPLTVTSEKDEALDGVVEEVEARVYDHDSSGYWLVVETDYGADGVLESRYEVRYDLDDRRQEITFDDGADGFVDKFQEFFYTDDGQTHRIDVTTYGLDGTEAATRVFHEYTDDARIAEIGRDDGGDGSLDGITAFSWDCP